MTGKNLESEPSLNEGLGAKPDFKKPRAGTKPSELLFIQIVPPVMTIRTLASAADVSLASPVEFRKYSCDMSV